MNNEDVLAACTAMKHLTSGPNRLPTLPALRAARIRDRLIELWKPVGELQAQLLADHGTTRDGATYTFEQDEDAEAYRSAWTKALAEEREVELVEALTLTDLEAGFVRTADGKKEYAKAGELGVDLSPEQLGLLMRLGIVVGPQAEA